MFVLYFNMFIQKKSCKTKSDYTRNIIRVQSLKWIKSSSNWKDSRTYGGCVTSMVLVKSLLDVW